MPLEVLLLALIIDLVIGEPPARIHPVVLMGKLIAALQKIAKPTRMYGIGIVFFVIFSTAIASHLLIVAADKVAILGLFISAYLLKSTIAIRCLLSTSAQIGRLIEDDFNKARVLLPVLVSRNPEDLSKSQASSAVIESLSENYVDTVVSPLFYYLVFSSMGLGVEAALTYKAVNTLDSMLGYKTEEFAKLGWASAKLDDLANWIPARLSLVIMAVAYPWKAGKIMSIALRDHAIPPSPNSGWPMAAAAGALGVKLEKPGIYTIQKKGTNPTTAHVPQALKFVGAATALTVVISALLLVTALYP
ncbi:MAG: cobalamin biosynthesis protein [Methanotrichaceae archaeon]